jgi:membrane protease YdiL (CAAX protease family)
MPLYLPFIPLAIWFGATSLAVSLAPKLLGNLQGWQGAFRDNLVLSAGGIAVIAVIIFLARASFARRLKGFGLNVKTIHKDFLAAFVNLLAVWPLVLAAILLTIFFGKLIYGQDFQMQQHEELEMITAYPQLSLRILIVILAVVIAPLLEEMLFRGFFQTVIRSFWEIRNPNGASPASSCRLLPRLASKDAEARKTGAGAWPPILISSALFAMVHSNPGHWPALFILAVCLGYAYEKSGSLFRPIFIHSFFNAVTIIAALSQ